MVSPLRAGLSSDKRAASNALEGSPHTFWLHQGLRAHGPSLILQCYFQRLPEAPWRERNPVGDGTQHVRSGGHYEMKHCNSTLHQNPRQGLTADQTQSFPTSEEHFQAEKHSPVHLDLTLSSATWALPSTLPPELNPQLCHLNLSLSSATWASTSALPPILDPQLCYLD